MRTTLREVSDSKGFSPFELLKLKKELLSYKKKGKLFFEEDVSNLDWDAPFEIYYFQIPSDKSSVNPFPVPSRSFRFIKDESQLYSHLRVFFERYYKGAELSFHDFCLYNHGNPYIAEEFVWYCKKPV